MKYEVANRPCGRTANIDLDDETYVTVTTGSIADERVDVDFKEHIIRVYSDAPFKLDDFMRGGDRRVNPSVEKIRPRLGYLLYEHSQRGGFEGDVPQGVSWCGDSEG